MFHLTCPIGEGTLENVPDQASLQSIMLELKLGNMMAICLRCLFGCEILCIIGTRQIVNAFESFKVWTPTLDSIDSFTCRVTEDIFTWREVIYSPHFGGFGGIPWLSGSHKRSITIWLKSKLSYAWREININRKKWLLKRIVQFEVAAFTVFFPNVS